MQSFFAAIMILSSTSLLTALSILVLLFIPIFFLVKKGSGSPKITIHGIENIPTNGGTIFVASQIRFDEQFALLNLPVKKNASPRYVRTGWSSTSEHNFTQTDHLYSANAWP